MHASFARPSVGGAAKASFIAPPTSPISAFFLARGFTLIAKVAPAAVSRIGITNYNFTTESQSHRAAEDLQRTDLFDSVGSTVLGRGESLLLSNHFFDLLISL
jgi:hypothetical protein